jgi:hypothetical protein
MLTTSDCYNATSLVDLYDSMSMFVLTMKSTNCYETLSATLLPAEDKEGNVIPGKVNVSIQAKEKNWYKLNIGGGVKQFSSNSSFAADSLSLPTVQVSLQYTLGRE